MEVGGAALDISVVDINAEVKTLFLVRVIVIAALTFRGTGAVHVCCGFVEDHHVSILSDVFAEPHGLVATLPLRPPLLSQNRLHGRRTVPSLDGFRRPRSSELGARRRRAGGRGTGRHGAMGPRGRLGGLRV